MCIETAWMLCWETQAWLYRRWQITGILIWLRCTNDAGFCFAFFKNKLKVCSSPALISTIFPTASALPVSVTFWWLSRWKGKWKSLSRVRLYSPWDYQARILEWVAFTSSRGSSQPMDRTRVYCIAGGFFTSWATMKARQDWIHTTGSFFIIIFATVICDQWSWWPLPLAEGSGDGWHFLMSFFFFFFLNMPWY